MQNKALKINEPKLTKTNGAASFPKVNTGWRKRMSRRRFQRPRPRMERSQWYIFPREDYQQLDGTVLRKRVRVRLGPAEAMNYTQAMRAADQYMRRINSVSYRPRSCMTFREFAEKWMEACLKQPTYKPSSIAAIRSGINRHLLPAFGRIELADIGPEHVDRFTGSTNGVAGKTIRNLMFILKSIFRKAVAWGYLSDDTDWFRGVDIPTAERGRGRVYSAEQVHQQIDAAEEPENLFYWLIAETAFRAGEACGVRWGDIDLVEALIVLQDAVWRGKRTGSTKTRDKRPVPISRALAAALAEWKKKCERAARENEKSCTPSSLVFQSKHGAPWYPDLVVKRKLHPLQDKLGIPRAGLHAFRHALGTAWARSGVPLKTIQAQLGHATSSTTVDYYLHLVQEDQRKAVEAWSVRIRPKEEGSE